MALSIDILVKDTIGSLAEPLPTIAMRGLCLTDSLLIPVDLRFFLFNDVESVATWFGEDSEEYAQATAYFDSFVGKNIYGVRPTAMYFGRAVTNSVAPYLRGAANPKLSDLVALGAGTIAFYFDDTLYPVDLEVADYTSLANVATVIQTQLIAGGLTHATTRFDAVGQCFIVSNGVTGAGETVGYASSGDGGPLLAEALLLTLDTGAELSQGADPETFTQTMLAITKNLKAFMGLWLLYQYDNDYYLNMLNYLSNANVAYMGYRTVASIQELKNLVTFLESNGYAKQVSLSNGKLIYRFNVCICLNVSRNNGNRINAAINGTYNSWAVDRPASFLSAVNKQYATLIPEGFTDAEYNEIIKYGGNVFDKIAGGFVEFSVYRIAQCGSTGDAPKVYGSQVHLTWFYAANYIRVAIQTNVAFRMVDGRTVCDLAGDANGVAAVVSWITQVLQSCAYDKDKQLNGNGMIKPTDVLAEGANGEYELEQLSTFFGLDIQTLNNAFRSQGYIVMPVVETFESKLESTMYINYAYVVTGDIATIICQQIPVI